MFAALGLHSFPIAKGEQLCHARNLSRVLCPQSTPPAEEDGHDEDSCQSNSLTESNIQISKRLIQIAVKRDVDGSLGVTLCGGVRTDNPSLSRPLVVSHVRRGGPVHREGSIRPGDRLLAVDGHSTEHATLAEALALLQHHNQSACWEKGGDDLECSRGSTPCCSGECCKLLVVEYDVVEREGLSEARGPLLVELLLDHPGEELGLSLAMLPEGGALPAQHRSAALVEAVRPASIAERCGALHSGDVLLSIGEVHHRDALGKNGVSTDGDPHNLTPRASWVLHMEVLPLSQMDRPTSARGSECGSNGSKQDLLHPGSARVVDMVSQSQCDVSSSSSGSLVWNARGSQRWPPPPMLPRRESSENIPPQIGSNSSAIHHVPSEEILHLEEFLQTTDFRASNDAVKIDSWQRRSSTSLGGVALDCANGSDNQEECQAQRSFPGLKPIAWLGANNENLDRCPPLHNDEVDSDAARIEVEPNSTSCFPLMPYVEDRETEVYVVQVPRNGGPLGITLSGTEDPLEYIIISGLVEGGPAKRTAALRIGDRLLAVGGESLAGRPLSEAVALLRAASDPVLLHVARPSRLSVDHSSTGDGITMTKIPSTNLEIEGSFLPLLVDSAGGGVTRGDEAANISVEAASHSPGAVCSCPSTNCHQPHLKHCTSSHHSLGTVNVLHRPLSYDSDHQSSLNHSSRGSIGTVGSMRGGQSARPVQSDTLRLTLFKDGIYEDFGFSVSDGLYERGVYVNRIRKGGPADIGSLQPYDRIIQVNDTITYAFDCCLTVPLIASAGDKIDLTVVRCPILEMRGLSY